jgi:hypothetical protein
MDKLREILEQMREYEVLTEGSDVHDNKTYMEHVNKCLDKAETAITKLFKERIDKVMDDHEPTHLQEKDLLFWYNRLRAELRKKVGENGTLGL